MMTPPTSGSMHEDPRIMQVAREYLADVEAGLCKDRQTYLARHPELGAELAEYLNGIDMAHEAGLMRRPLPEQQLGTLGDFQIVREIGRGGMGVVYEAIQISLNRMVALKVLPFAAALDDRQLQRFRNEAQAAAGLHHAHIVPVHGVGCDRGVHFYAMQLIDGRPLDAVIREMRGDAISAAPGHTTVAYTDPATVATPGVGKGTLPYPTVRTGHDRESYRWVARLAADVADALHDAHQAGVVHRDVKPANLMIDSRGVIWVTDFGLAHVNDANLTRTGDVVGTLRYMSPEQASSLRVLVDHRADVYSLGATLYEMLTLRPMFDAQDRGALLNQILNEEPTPPRKLDRSIPTELETIALKAVSKDASDRYATAQAMADDLRRFLDDRPIKARRPSLAERVRRWTRRHASFVGATVLLLAFSTLVLTAAVVWVGRAHAAEQNRAREAEDRMKLAERAVDDLVQMALDLRDVPGLDTVRKELLEMALGYHREFIQLHQDDRNAQARLEENRARVETILTGLIDKDAMWRVALLKDEAVLDDMKLSAEEREEVKQLNERLRQKCDPIFREFPRLSADQREQQFLKMARDHEATAAEVLRPELMKRLRQIDLQRQGPEAFRRPNVAAALKLTAAQRVRVRGLIADPYAGKPQPQGWPSPDSIKRKHKASLEQIVALLTVEQAARWKAMIGEPFTGRLATPGGKGGHPKFRPWAGRRGQ